MINSFGDWLREELEEQGKTQEWLVEKTGFEPEAIEDLASGKTKRPSMYKVWKVCGALGVPLGPVMQMLLAGDETDD